MSKSKLDLLLGAVKAHIYLHSDIQDAYQAYMEERKTLPQSGQIIEVRATDTGEWVKRKFIGFSTTGKVVVESMCGTSIDFNNYRIPTPKKKWKVVRRAGGKPFLVSEEDYIIGDIITTFED